MRTIESATIFRKELKKLRAHPDHGNLDALLETVLELLVIDTPLPIKNRDHPLTGPYKGFRDCHIKPDVVLIYSKPTKNHPLVSANWDAQRGVLRWNFKVLPCSRNR